MKNFRLNFKYALSEESSKTPVTVTLKYSDNSTSKALDDVKWTDISVPISSANQLSSITFSGKNFFIDEISIISEDFITIGSTGYATLYYSGRAIKIPTDLTAYTDPEDGKLYLCERTGEQPGGKVTLQFLPHELVELYFTEV